MSYLEGARKGIPPPNGAHGIAGGKPADRGHGDDGITPLPLLKIPLVGADGGPEVLSCTDVDRNGQVRSRYKRDHQKLGDA